MVRIEQIFLAVCLLIASVNAQCSLTNYEQECIESLTLANPATITFDVPFSGTFQDISFSQGWSPVDGSNNPVPASITVTSPMGTVVTITSTVGLISHAVIASSQNTYYGNSPFWIASSLLAFQNEPVAGTWTFQYYSATAATIAGDTGFQIFFMTEEGVPCDVSNGAICNTILPFVSPSTAKVDITTHGNFQNMIFAVLLLPVDGSNNPVPATVSVTSPMGTVATFSVPGGLTSQGFASSASAQYYNTGNFIAPELMAFQNQPVNGTWSFQFTAPSAVSFGTPSSYSFATHIDLVPIVFQVKFRGTYNEKIYAQLTSPSSHKVLLLGSTFANGANTFTFQTDLILDANAVMFKTFGGHKVVIASVTIQQGSSFNKHGVLTSSSSTLTSSHPVTFNLV